MQKMFARSLSSLYRSGRSIAVSKQLLTHPPRQHYFSYSTGVAARTTLLNFSSPMAKHLSSDDYGSPLSRGLGSRRLLHGESCSKDYDVYVQHMFEKIRVDFNDSLEKVYLRRRHLPEHLLQQTIQKTDVSLCFLASNYFGSTDHNPTAITCLTS